MLKPLSELNNTIGFEDDLAGKTLNGAVMTFRKHRYYFCILLSFHLTPYVTKS